MYSSHVVRWVSFRISIPSQKSLFVAVKANCWSSIQQNQLPFPKQHFKNRIDTLSRCQKDFSLSLDVVPMYFPEGTCVKVHWIHAKSRIMKFKKIYIFRCHTQYYSPTFFQIQFIVNYYFHRNSGFNLKIVYLV